MNLLYVTDSPTVSGAEHVLLHYLERFRPPAYRTHVLLRATNHRLIEQLRARDITFSASHSFSDRIIRTTANPRELAAFARAFRGIRREMQRLRDTYPYDLVHAISYPASLYVAIAVGRTGVPQVWHEHNIKRIHRFNRPIYRWTGRRCAWVIGPSRAVTSQLAKSGMPAERVLAVYNGIDLERFRPDADARRRARSELGLGDEDLAIGLVGQLLPYKGHRALLAAAAEVRARLPRAKYFIVGALENPPYQDELRERVAALGLMDRVVFTGWRRDVEAVIQAMDVLAVPTETPEPAALSLMEAMALERPLIATRTGGTPEIVVDGETGLLCDPARPDQLAEALVRLGQDQARRERMGRAGRQRVAESFSLPRHLAEIERLYRSTSS